MKDDAEDQSEQQSKMRRELLGCGVADSGQLGIYGRDVSFKQIPESIPCAPLGSAGSSVVAVACGEKHTILLCDDGKVWTCGANDEGQLGRKTEKPGSFTIYPLQTFGRDVIQIAAGRAHSLAVLGDGRLFAWGSNRHGQLGRGHSVPIAHSDTPKRIPDLTEVVQVASGPEHCMALCQDGRLFVWGEQYDGAILHSPVELKYLHGVPLVRISAGGRHCVALSASGAVYTWGHNEYGQLGVGDTTPKATPQFLEGVSTHKVVEVACGDAHTVLLTREGRVYTFGADSMGQLGSNRQTDKQTTPKVVDELMGSAVRRIACGRCHTIALVGGKVYPFGLNTSGQLGNGLARNQLIPRLTDELDHVTNVFAGWDQTFMIRAVGSMDSSPGPNSAVQVPRFIDRSIIEGLLSQRDKLGLIENLESVFSSQCCINGSFLFEDDRRYLAGLDAKRNHGVDMESVMETFNILAATGDAKQYSELILDSVTLSFFQEFDPAHFHSIECLRVMLILPWLDVFVSNITEDIVKKLHEPYAMVLGKLNNTFRKPLDKWWMALPSRHFNRVVSGLVAAVRFRVNRHKQPAHSKTLLDALFSLNKLNKGTEKIPLEHFYIHELNTNFCLKTDLVHYLEAPDSMKESFWANYPFLMDGVAKGELLYVEAIVSMQQSLQGSTLQMLGINFFLSQPYMELIVRRDNIVQDTINGIRTAESLSKPLKVRFANEEGEDEGGVKKEFFMILFQKILSPEYGMFREDPDSRLVWFSGMEIMELEYYSVIGALCALAVYNRVLVAFPFPLALYKAILGQPVTLEDLCELSPVEGKGLQALLDYEGDDVEDVFCLNFTISFTIMDTNITNDLKRNGSEISVTSQNKAEYVKCYVQHRLMNGPSFVVEKQIASFVSGFKSVLHSRIINFFQPRELMEQVVGNENYDWSEFKEVVQYRDPYNVKHPTVQAFWEAFFELTEDERKLFLQFLSGTTRLPVVGMKDMQVWIQPSQKDSIPVAHTCANLLDLPDCPDKTELLKRLRICIHHAEGFTLV